MEFRGKTNTLAACCSWPRRRMNATPTLGCRRADSARVPSRLRTLPNAWPYLALLALLWSAVGALGAGPYDLEIVARTDQSRLLRIEREVSISDQGVVAFIGRLPGGGSIFIADGENPPRHISFVGDYFGAGLQINNHNQIVAYDFTIGGPFGKLGVLRLHDGNAQNSFQNLEFGGWPTQGAFDGLFPYPGLNNRNQAVFSAEFYDWFLATTDGTTLNKRPIELSVWPMIADDGTVAVRERNGSADTIRLYAYNLLSYRELVNTGMGFTILGFRAGLSDDGGMVAFYGVLNDSGAAALGTVPGPGIFVCFTDSGNIIRVSRPADANDPFSDPISSYCALERPSVNNTGTVVLAAINDRGQKAIVSSMIDLKATPRAALPSVQVVAVGDSIEGLPGVVEDLALYDSVNNKEEASEIAFWWDFGAGQAVVRGNFRRALRGCIRFWDRTPIQQARVLLVDANHQVVAQALSTNDGSYKIDLGVVTKPGSYYLKACTEGSRASRITQKGAWPTSDGEAENWFTDGQPGPHAWADYADPYARPDLVLEQDGSGVLKVAGGDAQEAYERGQADICFPQPIVWVHGIYADTRRFYQQYVFFSAPLADSAGTFSQVARGVVDCSLSYFVEGMHTEDPKRLGHLLQSNLTCDDNAAVMEDYMTQEYDQGMRALVAEFDRGAGSRPAINLVCHSMGAPISRLWLCRSNADERHGRVTNCVSISGIHGGNYAASFYTYRVPLSVLTRDQSAQSCAVRYVYDVNNDGKNAYWQGAHGNLYFAWGEKGTFMPGLLGFPGRMIWRELRPHDGVSNAPSAASQNGPYRGWKFKVGALRIDLSDLFRADLNLDLRTTLFGQHVRNLLESRGAGGGSLAGSMLAKVDLASVENKEGFGDHSFMDSGRGCMASYAVWLGLDPDPGIPKRYEPTNRFAQWEGSHYVPLPGERVARGQGAPGAMGEDDALVATVTEEVVGPGWSQEYRIPVDGCAEVQMAVEWDAGCHFNVQLLDAAGQAVLPVPAGDDGEPGGAEATGQYYAVTNPVVGMWTLAVEAGAGVPAEGVPLMVWVQERTALQLVGRLIQDKVRPGETAVLQAAVARGDEVLALPLEVDGWVTNPRGEVAALTLYDDGRHGDEGPGDGLYGAQWGETGMSGEYTIDLLAAGTNDRGERFQRSGVAVLQVMSAKALFTGMASEQAVDNDGNGRYDNLVVTLGLEVKKAGGFAVSGRLVSEAGQLLAVASWQGQLEVGTRMIGLAFAGRSIGNSFIDGPYQVEGVSLAELGGARVRGVGVGHTLACDEWAKALSTRSYTCWEFERDRDGSPRLRVQHNGDRLRLAWPAGASGYLLQKSRSLSSPVQWTTVTNSPTTDLNETKVDLPVLPDTAFYYRLSKP